MIDRWMDAGNTTKSIVNKQRRPGRSTNGDSVFRIDVFDRDISRCPPVSYDDSFFHRPVRPRCTTFTNASISLR